MQLRDYQKESTAAAMAWIKKSIDPCCIILPTGAGKSWVAAGIASELTRATSKKVLVTAPTGELVAQNYEKYLSTGCPASIFSASLGKKDLRHPVVFGTPQTIKNGLSRFKQEFSCVIVDEAHEITPTIKAIISHLRIANEKLRVIGMTATPYRLGDGYIFANHYIDGKIKETRSPYYHTAVHEVKTHDLINQGWLSTPVVGLPKDFYDTSQLILKSNGQWDAASVDKTFLGHERKTARIIDEVVKASQDRKGVLVFAATVKHAEEILGFLPKDESAIVTGITETAQRKRIIDNFKSQKGIKYLVNVGVLTRGFDAPHVDVIAILRATESVTLLQQIIGRGCRIAENKKDFLILDYAENLKRHCPDGDLFAPKIKAKAKEKSKDKLICKCPECEFENEFTARDNPDNFGIDDYGYFLDALDKRISLSNGFLPAHYGRKCTGERLFLGKHVQCGYKWSFKTCPSCGGENDLAARHCRECGFEIIDPEIKLKEIAYSMSLDPYQPKTTKCNGWEFRSYRKFGGKDCLLITYKIEQHPYELREYFYPEHEHRYVQYRWKTLQNKLFKQEGLSLEEVIERGNKIKAPEKIAYKRKEGTKYYEVISVEFGNN